VIGGSSDNELTLTIMDKTASSTGYQVVTSKAVVNRPA
jgi:hypothetical protein